MMLSNITIRALLSRHSTRQYDEKNVEPQILEQLLLSGLCAPNGGNHQVVRLMAFGKVTVDELNDAIVRYFRSCEPDPELYYNKSILRARTPDCHFFFHAPVLISAIAPQTHANSMADSACALENIQIAAESLALGSCWINTPHWTADKSCEVRRIFEKHGMREDEAVFGSVIVGYPRKNGSRFRQIKEGRVILSDDLFGDHKVNKQLVQSIYDYKEQ